MTSFVLSIGIRAWALVIRLYILESTMSFRELVHDPTFIFDGTNYDVWKIRTFIFDGTNYDVWKIRILNLFRDMGPNYVKRIVEIGRASCRERVCLYV